MLMPNFARFTTIPQPVWGRGGFLYFFSFLLALSWVGVFARANLTFFFLVHHFRGPMVRVLVTLMLPGKFFLVILSCVAANYVPFGKVTSNGTARRLGTIFSLIFSFSHQKRFLIWVLILYLEMVQQQKPEVLLEIAYPFVSYIFFFTIFIFLAPMYQTPFFRYGFPLILTNLCQFDWLHIFYVLRSGHFLLKYKVVLPRNEPKTLTLTFSWLPLLVECGE